MTEVRIKVDDKTEYFIHSIETILGLFPLLAA